MATRNDFKYFFIDDFLNQELLQRVTLDSTNLPSEQTLPNICGYLISDDGKYEQAPDHPYYYNRYHDNSILKSLLPGSIGEVIDLVKTELQQYMSNPVIYNFATMKNIVIDKREINGRWHKDYNPIENFFDDEKQWLVFISLSKDNVNSTFQITPTSEWPNIWNIGLNETLSNNRLFAHNMNLGHQYHQHDIDDVTLLGMRWYDKLSNSA